MDEITDHTYERVGYLISEYARLCKRTNTEVAHALLASKTLKRPGYRHEQKGHLTETQGKAAIQVLDFWIRSHIEQHQPS
jgi:hypothetical protein